MMKKPAKKQKLTREEAVKRQEEWHNAIPDSEVNPNGKEDFEALLRKIIPPFEPKKKSESSD